MGGARVRYSSDSGDKGTWKGGVADGARLGQAGGGCIEGETVRSVAVGRARFNLTFFVIMQLFW